MNLLNLQSLFTSIEAATPDGRWNLLQEWLKANPDWKEEIDGWLKTPSDDVVKQLINTIATRFDMSPDMVQILTPSSVKARAKAAIEKIQACYRERANNNQSEQQKEIKHVRTKSARRMVKRASKTNQ